MTMTSRSSKTPLKKTRKPRASSADATTSSLILRTQIHPTRKIYGYVPHHYACGWSSKTQVDDYETTNAREKASALLTEHLKTCPLRDDLSIPH